jgi:hypothetical protein
MAAFALLLLADLALAFWLRGTIPFWRMFKSLTFESASSNGSHAYALKFGHGHVDLDFASPGPDGTTEIHSFHLHY